MIRELGSSSARGWQRSGGVDRTGMGICVIALLVLHGLLAASASAQFTEQDRLTAAVFADGDGDGWSVAVSGDYAIVGAPETDHLGIRTGVAYILERDGSGVWDVVDKLVPSDAGSDPFYDRFSNFGWSVDIATSVIGTFAVVGAPRDREPLGPPYPGAVYVYERTPTGWTEITKLTPPAPPATEDFGWSVALSGGFLVVGAPREPSLGTFTGAAYVYFRYLGVWEFSTQLIGSNTQAGDRFGHDVDVLGLDVLVVAPGRGTVYHFSGTLLPGPSYSWSEDTRLLPGVQAFFDSVSVSDVPGFTVDITVAAVGSPSFSAGVLLYEDFPGSGSQIRLPSAQITPPVSDAGFGSDVSLARAGDSLFLGVGAAVADASGPDAGRVHLYERTGFDTYTPLDTLDASDASEDDFLGASVGVSGRGGVVRVIAGAPGADRHGADSGAAYVFEEVASAWTEVAQQLPYDNDPLDRFGEGLAMEGGQMLVGAPGDAEKRNNAGAVYAFEEVGGSWIRQQKLPIPTSVSGAEEFGAAIAISGDRAIVGVPYERHAASDAGAVYFYERIGGIWTEVDRLTASDASAADLLGASVDIDGDLAIAGAPGANAAYVFRNGTFGWFEGRKLEGVHVNFDPGRFGFAVSIRGDRAVVGDPLESGGSFPLFYLAGGAYVFEQTAPGTWKQETRLGPPGSGTARLQFGAAVATDGEVTVIGAPNSFSQEGRAHVFRRGSLGWSPISELARPVALTGARFGQSVDLDGQLIAIGEIGTADPGTAWIYHLLATDDVVPFGSLPNTGGFAGDGHGGTVVLDGQVAAVGAPGATAGGTDAGAVTTYLPEPDPLWGLAMGVLALVVGTRVERRRRQAAIVEIGSIRGVFGTSEK